MPVPTSEEIKVALQQRLNTGEALTHWAFAQSKPPAWMLWMALILLIPSLVVGLLAANLAIAAGVIRPGPMMPVVAMVVVMPLWGLYLYLGLSKVRRYAVGITAGRLLIADLKDDAQAQSHTCPLDDISQFSGSIGLVPGLRVRTANIVLKLQFPLNIRGNKEQASAIVKRVKGDR